MRLVLPEDRAAHRIEEAAGLIFGLILLSRCCFQFLDAHVGALQRFVLHQRRLHQRIDRIGRVAQALHDRVDIASGSRLALSSLASRSKRSSISWRSCGVMALSLASDRRQRAGQM